MQRTFIDQMQRNVTLEYPPRRIVSVVPSQTELLHFLNLNKEIVGITKFCIHPDEWYRTKPRVGGTKQLHLEKIEALQPDLILGNKEENEHHQIEALAKKYPVWMSDIQSLEDAFEMIRQVGQLVGKSELANELGTAIQNDFKNLPKPQKPIRAAYFIWRKPYMVAAADTFIHNMIQVAGFQNVFAHRSRYPDITLEELAEAEPEVILLSSEPYPFKAKHLAEFQQVCQSAVIQFVDGELFSWYGSRLLHSAAYFRNLHATITSNLKN